MIKLFKPSRFSPHESHERDLGIAAGHPRNLLEHGSVERKNSITDRRAINLCQQNPRCHRQNLLVDLSPTDHTRIGIDRPSSIESCFDVQSCHSARMHGTFVPSDHNVRSILKGTRTAGKRVPSSSPHHDGMAQSGTPEPSHVIRDPGPRKRTIATDDAVPCYRDHDRQLSSHTLTCAWMAGWGS